MRFLSTLLLCAAALSAQTAQSQLTTTFAGGLAGPNGGAVFFDLTPTAAVTWHGFDLNFTDPTGTVGSVSIFTRAGTASGFEGVAGGWTFVETVNVTAAPIGLLTHGDFSTGRRPSLNALTGVAVVANGLRHQYTNGPGSFSSCQLNLTAISAKQVPFLPGPVLAPRTVNANIYYTSDGPDICAAATPFGSGCSSCFASCYEFFPTPAAFTLASRSITMVPTDPGYTVVAGFTPVLPRSNAAVALTLADDDEVTVPLAPGSFRGCYGQPWSAMSICSNGRVSEAPSNGLVAAPSIPTMLGNLYTAFYSQGDWNPAAGGTVWFDPGPTTTVTWDNVPSFGVPGSSNTFQMQFFPSGVVILCWEAMSVSGVNGGILVGYSPGGPSADPGPKDLAAFFPPFDLCCDDERPLALSTFAGDRPVQPLSGPADPFQVLTTNIHPLDVIHVGVLGLSNLGTAGWPLFSFGFGLGDCHLYCQPDAVFLSVLPPATTAWQWTAANLFPPGPDYKSIQFCVQSLTLRPPSPGPSDRASNALACIVGNQ